ncbi:MAG TPA: TetR/AcrR family transcriptional regulator [Nocardioides sp.]|uniref:TetR/AcrR family transcriptional regulator n=1 Tax=Nocardioides sp. TaxID=35761 RepID=UPI002F400B2F
MTRNARARLAATVSHVPGTSRRAQYSASTRRALVDVAERLFAEHGYAATSLDAIVAGADVTKGALYHHFSGKQALFEAVFEKVEAAGAQTVQATLREQRDPWEKAIAGLRAFLDVVRQPSYSRIVVQDGPSVLGYERFREQEERSTFANVRDIVRAVLGAGEWDVDRAMEGTFARIFFGAMSSAGTSVSTADDADTEAERVELAIGFILSGLRALSEQGTRLSGLPDTPTS